MSQILNMQALSIYRRSKYMLGFCIYHGSEYARVTQVSEYA